MKLVQKARLILFTLKSKNARSYLSLIKLLSQ